MTRRLILISLLSMISHVGFAWSWQDLWLTKDQQGQQLMQKGQYKQAQNLFENPEWQASAAYRSGAYQQAAEQFSQLNTEEGFYNQGNALARLGQYEQAIKAYDKALAINPQHEDARYNRKLVEALLKKEKQQQQNKNQDSSQQNNQNNSKDQNQQNGQNQPSNNQQQDKAQQQQNQQNSSKNQANQDKKDEKKPAQNQPSQQHTNQNQDNKQPADKQQQPLSPQQTTAEKEKQQAKEQWLRLIPDDPGGLLREKFLRDHIRRQRGWYP